MPSSPTEPPSATDASTRWADPRMGKRWQYRFFHILLRWLGKRPAYHIMYIVTFCYVLFFARVRRRTRPYLDRRFATHRSGWRCWWDSYQLIRHFGMTLVDMAAAQIIGDRAASATSPDQAQFDELNASGAGFILLHAHVGCWQLGLSTLAHLNKRVALGMIPDPKVSALIDARRGYIVDPRDGYVAVMRMTQALLDGEVVSLMADRTFGDTKNVVRATFLGDPVDLPLAPYRLASATGCGVVLAAAAKTGFTTYEMRILTRFRVPPRLGSKPENYAPYAQKVAGALERFCDQYPWQYANFYDLWETVSSATPPGEHR